MEKPITTIEDLEERLSRPDEDVVKSVLKIDGDLVILGAAGKMGPTLARMAKRAFQEAGKSGHVIAVARFTDSSLEAKLKAQGIKTIRCDLLNREEVTKLPDATSMIYMAGQKFGTSHSPELTWAMNVLAPSIAAEKYAGARTVVFSTGNIYGNSPVLRGGSVESDSLQPVGEYANTCVGREQVFNYHSLRQESPLLHFRLNYAIDLRYGVLLDIARKVYTASPIDLTMGHVNVIWQGDANRWAIRSLNITTCPATALNITGPKTLWVRAIAEVFGLLFDKAPVFTGTESDTALLSNATRAFGHFGYPSVTLAQMLEWIAAWVKSGGPSLDKPTHFEARDGRF